MAQYIWDRQNLSHFPKWPFEPNRFLQLGNGEDLKFPGYMSIARHPKLHAPSTLDCCCAIVTRSMALLHRMQCALCVVYVLCECIFIVLFNKYRAARKTERKRRINKLVYANVIQVKDNKRFTIFFDRILMVHARARTLVCSLALSPAYKTHTALFAQCGRQSYTARFYGYLFVSDMIQLAQCKDVTMILTYSPIHRLTDTLLACPFM